jgi:hypothetical protein
MLGRLLCKDRLRFFSLTTAPLFRIVFFPSATALKIVCLLEHSGWKLHMLRTGTSIAVTLLVSEAFGRVMFLYRPVVFSILCHLLFDRLVRS